MLETRCSDAGGASTAAYKGDRNRQGLYWESEGFIVPFEGKGQHNLSRGKGPCFVNATEEWRIWGIAVMLLTPSSIRTLQRKLYRKAKQEPDYSEMGDGACLTVNNIGKPCAGKPHARFDEGGQAEWPALYSTFAVTTDYLAGSSPAQGVVRTPW